MLQNQKMKSKNNNNKNIPEGWQQVKLGEICDISAGGTPSTKIKEYWNGNIPWMNSGDLNKRIIFDVEGRITELGLKSSSAKLVPINSVLIGLAGQGKTRGTVAINKIELTTNQSVAFFIPKKINYKFLYFDLFNRYEELRQLSAGDGGRGGLNLYLLKNIKLPLPPLPEQNRIVEVLETWDKYLEDLDKKIKIKKKIKKGLMQRLLNGDKRLKGFSGEWNKITLEEVISNFSTGLNPRDNFKLGHGNNYYVTIKNISNGKLNFSKAETVDDTALKLINKRSKLSKDSIIMSSIGNVGECYLLSENPKKWDINESVFCLKPNIKIIYPKFIYYIIINDKTKKYFENNITGSSFKSIKMKDLRKMPFKIPELKEQQAIAEVLTKADEEIEKLEEKRKAVADQKKYLLNNLITGKIRIPA
ncbi:MAG: restriction endonuclease subunit S [Patescibacteria group bacterium]